MGKENSHQLKPHEKQVLQLLSRGFNEKEVAIELNKSVYTIDKYLRSVFDKYGVHNTTAAVAQALRLGEIE